MIRQQDKAPPCVILSLCSMTEDQQVCGTLSHVAVRSGYYQTTFFLTISRLLRPPLLVVVLIWIFLPAAIGSSFSYHSLPGSAILHSASYLPCNSRAPFCYAFLFGVGVRGRFQPLLDAGGGFPHPAASTLHPVDAKSESFLILVWLFIFLEARVKHFLSTHTNESICP